jgi:apolipoprotein D and lipocalin family protein
MRRRLTLPGIMMIGAASLVGCAKTPPDAPQNRRDTAAQISSASLFEADRFAGEWRVEASHTAGCRGADQTWARRDYGWDISGIDCTGPAPAALSARADLVGPGGRIMPSGGYGDEPLWVLWMDQDYRVAALGAPSGHHAVILARPGAARADLISAAREVLAFNGYAPEGLAK